MYQQNFNLQKALIVCYTRKFPHKRPPCYALNTQKGPHDVYSMMLCTKFLSEKAPMMMICAKFLSKKGKNALNFHLKRPQF